MVKNRYFQSFRVLRLRVLMEARSKTKVILIDQLLEDEMFL